MALNTANAHAYGDITQAISTAPLGATAPTAPLPTTLPANWSDLGWISDGGVTESKTFQETKKYAWQGGSIIRNLRSQFENPFQFQALEENAVTLGLLRPGKTITPTAGTAEVQTVTLTGTGTAGTWSITLPAYGTASGLAYNISTAALITALNAAFGMTGIAVTGTPGTSYVVTFPAIYGNVGLMTFVNSITGVTNIAAVETTPGVSTTYSQGVSGAISRNLRQFSIDLVDGVVRHRYYIPLGEVVSSGDIVYQANDLTVYEFTLTPYPDANGNFYYDLTNNPVMATAFA